MISSIISKIESLQEFTPDIVICGDFNIPHTLINDAYTPTENCNKQLLNTLQDFMMHLNLNQSIHKETHTDGNILDFLLTNNHEMIFDYDVTPTVHSDHHMIDILTHLTFTKTKKVENKKTLYSKFDNFNFLNKNINWEAINKDLQCIDWHKTLHSTSDPEKQYETFIDKCISVISANEVPSRKPKNSHKIIPRDRRVLMRNRAKLKRKHRSNKNVQKLIDIELKLQQSHRNERQKQELDATSKIKSNPKYFYSYAKKFSKHKPKVGPLIDPSTNELTTDSKRMANILQNQYSSVFTQPMERYDLNENDNNAPQLCDIDLTEADFINEINTLSSNSAPGPDGFPAILLKKSRHQLATPLCLIWRNILDKSQTPHLLKSSYITPIFKKGNQGLPENYRPVALTSNVSKVFEKIVRSKIQKHLEDNNLFNCNQHGFRSGRSCLSQLLSHTERLIHHIENGNNVDVIYLDFSKAFDKVDHTILLHKIKNNGIKGKLLAWIKSFITGRTQQVSVNHTLSERSEVISGVPQGSVLGPLLFLIMIQDIDERILHSFLSSFADDTRLMKEIKNLADIIQLQEDLNAVYEWTELNNMKLNGLKFEHLKYGRNEELKKLSKYYSDTQKVIETKTTVKDLGINLDVDMTYGSHIENVIDKVKGISSWIYRTFKTRDPTVMLTLWKTLAVPHIDYCSQLWSPSKRHQTQRLEQLQKSFLNGIPSLQNLNYWEKLKTLKLYSLERRRERYQIIYTWNILENYVPNFNHSENKGGITGYRNQRLGRKCHLKEVNSKCKNIWRGSLSEEGPKLFNSLPSHIRNITNCTRIKFKRQLDRFLSTLPDEPLLPNYYPYRRADSNSVKEMVNHRISKLDD